MSRERQIMEMASKVALEQATQALAIKAREFAKTLPPSVTGSQALEAFASAIESTNARQFKFGGRQ